MAIQVKKAIKHQVKLKLALIGPSGAGKTYSALRVAKGFGNRTLLLNTEGDRGYLYASIFEYDIVDLEPPYTVEKYIEVVKYAEDNQYDTLIIDSASHEWSGRGGLLELHEKASGNNGYVNWKSLTPKHNEFIDSILRCKVNVISCLRGKDQYVLEINEKGKQAPKKVGLGAEQRANYEYEMMLTLMIDQKSHIATSMKDNTGVFIDRYDVLTEEHGKLLKEWAENGVNLVAIKQKISIMAGLVKDCKYDSKTMSELIHERFKVASSKDLSEEQLDELIGYLESMKNVEVNKEDGN